MFAIVMCTGVVLEQPSSVQYSPSSRGTSVESASVIALPLPSQYTALQSFGVWGTSSAKPKGCGVYVHMPLAQLAS